MAASKSVVDKIAASRRQLDTAIWLWFNDGDIVSITTLVDAVWGVLVDLYHARKWKQPVPFDAEIPPPKGMTQRQWRKKAKEAGAFGKHARWDSDRAYEYSHFFTAAYMMTAIAAHSKLEKPVKGGLHLLFALWFEINCPGLVEMGPKTPEGWDVEQLKKIPRIKFLEFTPQYLANPPRPDPSGPFQWAPPL